MGESELMRHKLSYLIRTDIPDYDYARMFTTSMLVFNNCQFPLIPEIYNTPQFLKAVIIKQYTNCLSLMSPEWLALQSDGDERYCEPEFWKRYKELQTKGRIVTST